MNNLRQFIEENSTVEKESRVSVDIYSLYFTISVHKRQKKTALVTPGYMEEKLVDQMERELRELISEGETSNEN